MSVTELAVAAGSGHNGRGYISKIEHQHIRRLGEERLSRIATALHVPSADLLLRRLPESLEGMPVHDLDEAIIGARALLGACAEQSLERARLQLLQAKLHRDRAATSSLTGVKYAALTEAQACIERALPIFDAHKASRSLGEAEQPGQEMSNEGRK